MARIGVFGGSFNPVHRGHLKLAAEALSELNLEKIYFVPSFITPLKDPKKLLPRQVRLRLLKKALKGNPRFKISLCEMQRKGPSYTVDTLRHFKKTLGSGNTLYFLAGADTLKTIHRWKSPEKIFKLCRFVVADRPGHRIKKIPAGMLHMPLDALAISSTQIRKRSSARFSVRSSLRTLKRAEVMP